jgi:ribosomal protein L24E
MLFVRKDGAAHFYCSGKCQKNAVLKRSPHATHWTEFYRLEKEAEKKVREKKGGTGAKRGRAARKGRKKKKKRR